MINLIFALLTTLAVLATGVVFARAAYRREYKLIYGSPAPRVYGGRNGHSMAHRCAMREAAEWFGLWPLFLCWAGIGWLVSHGLTQDWVERDNEIRQAEEEVYRLAAQQDRLSTPEIIVTKHPERVININGDWISPYDWDWLEDK